MIFIFIIDIYCLILYKDIYSISRWDVLLYFNIAINPEKKTYK